LNLALHTKYQLSLSLPKSWLQITVSAEDFGAGIDRSAASADTQQLPGYALCMLAACTTPPIADMDLRELAIKMHTA